MVAATAIGVKASAGGLVIYPRGRGCQPTGRLVLVACFTPAGTFALTSVGLPPRPGPAAEGVLTAVSSSTPDNGRSTATTSGRPETPLGAIGPVRVATPEAPAATTTPTAIPGLDRAVVELRWTCSRPATGSMSVVSSLWPTRAAGIQGPPLTPTGAVSGPCGWGTEISGSTPLADCGGTVD